MASEPKTMQSPPRRPPHGLRYHPPGTAPGTLTPLPGRSSTVRVTVMDYGPEHVTEKEVARIQDLFPFRDTASVTWINVEGLSDVSLLESLGEHFKLHPLSLEDVLNCGQRPKVEDYDDYQFVVLKSLHLGDPGLATEQISLFLGSNYVITLQEVPGDSFDPVRERIRKGKGQIRRAGPDYLAYALIDALVDEFFPVLEQYGERIEELEDVLVDQPTPDAVRQIHALKRDLLILRRVAWPERDLVNALLRAESPLIHQETKVFLRDCYDHMVQAMDMIETYRELAGGMLDVYLSSVSNRMNEIMKVLTIISTIFIPLTFIAGVYGMNFDHIPELHWRHGYFYCLGLMLALGVALVAYFRRKGWL